MTSSTTLSHGKFHSTLHSARREIQNPNPKPETRISNLETQTQTQTQKNTIATNNNHDLKNVVVHAQTGAVLSGQQQAIGVTFLRTIRRMRHSLLMSSLEEARYMSAESVARAYFQRSVRSRQGALMPDAVRSDYLSRALRLCYVMLARAALSAGEEARVEPRRPHAWQIVFSSMDHLIGVVENWTVSSDSLSASDEDEEAIVFSSSYPVPASFTRLPIVPLSGASIEDAEGSTIDLSTLLSESTSTSPTPNGVCEFATPYHGVICQELHALLDEPVDVVAKNMYMVVIVELEGHMLCRQVSLDVPTLRHMQRELLSLYMADSDDSDDPGSEPDDGDKPNADVRNMRNILNNHNHVRKPKKEDVFDVTLRPVEGFRGACDKVMVSKPSKPLCDLD